MSDHENVIMSGHGGSNSGAAVSVMNGEGRYVAQLRAAFRGQVIGPDDAGYDEARAVFYSGIDARPAAIVRAADEVDVSHAVWSRARDRHGACHPQRRP